MRKQQAKHISFDRFKEIVEQSVQPNDKKTYLGKRFAMIKNILPSLRDSGFAKNLLQFTDLRIGFVKSGEIEGNINLHPSHLKQGTLISLTPNSIIEMKKFSKDVNFMGITLNPEQLNGWYKGPIPAFLINQMTESIMQPCKADLAVFFHLFNILWDVVHLYGDDSELIPDLMSAILHQVHHIYNTHAQQHVHQQTRERTIFQEFIQMVNQANGTQRQLDYYANRMNLTQRYLGTVIKQVSDVTAKEWIDRSTILRIKVMLRHSDQLITQISDQFGFPNDSFFSKYFKRMTGLTPKEYRNGKESLQTVGA